SAFAELDCVPVIEVRICSGGSDNDGVFVDGSNPAPDRPFAGVRVNLVGSAFLRTLGITLRLGRDIQDSDTASSPKVAIVNQNFVDRYLPGADPLGHHVAAVGDPKVEYTIVEIGRASCRERAVGWGAVGTGRNNWAGWRACRAD